jgi:hypothetical protein
MAAVSKTAVGSLQLAPFAVGLCMNFVLIDLILMRVVSKRGPGHKNRALHSPEVTRRSPTAAAE